MGRASVPPKPTVAAHLLVLAIFVVLMGATWFRHTDVGDAQVYQVIARHMLQDHRWLSLRYLPAVHPRFYDHLPFGFWPMAVTFQLLGEWGLVPLFAVVSIAIVVLTGLIARRLAGPWAGLAAMFVLGTTETFFFQTSYPTLDPLLILLTTGAVLPVFTGALRAPDWLLAGALTSAAIAVKGPFGLLPTAGAVVARAVVDRSLRTLLLGVGVVVLAAAPLAVFLRNHPEWWQGYAVHQVFDSLTGARADGDSHPMYAVRVIVGRFWPWLPLLIPPIVLALRWPAAIHRWLVFPNASDLRVQRACRLVLIATLVVVIGLSIPQRKLWHHTLLVYPFLSILCGLGVAPLLGTHFSTATRVHRSVLGLGALLLICAGAVASGLGQILMNPPCVVSREFSGALSRARPRQDVLVVSKRDEWDMLSALAFERDFTPWPTTQLNSVEHPRADLAIVSVDAWSADPQWLELARARGWVLAVHSGQDQRR